MDKSWGRPAALSAGSITGGVLVLVAATWVLPADFVAVAPDPNWLRIGAVVVTALAVAEFVSRDRQVPALRWFLAASSLAVAVLGVVGFVGQYLVGFPGTGTLLAALGGLAVAVGALMLRRVPSGRWHRPSLASSLVALGALLLVVVLAVPFLVVVPELRLTATTAGDGDPAPMPKEVRGVAWSAEIDGDVKEVAAAGMGAVVLVEDGVIALDGPTGQIRWSRRWAGAVATKVDVSPDGRTVVLQIRPPDEFPIRREVLNAVTGEVRHVVDDPNEIQAQRFYTPLTNVSRIAADEDRTEYSGYSLADGSKMWDYRVPAGCRIYGPNTENVAYANGMVLPMTCGDHEFRFVSVDAANGWQRWQHVVPLTAKFVSGEYQFVRWPDRRFVTFWLQRAAQPYTTLDTETGAVVASTNLKPLNSGYALDGQRILDLARGVSVSSPGIDCMIDAAPGTQSGAAVCRLPSDGFTERVLTTGSAQLGSVVVGREPVWKFTVEFGRPSGADTSSVDAEPLHRVPVPGSVIVYSELVRAANGRYRLVGLR